MKVERLHRITSGDPSRGTIALETMSAPPQGSIMRVGALLSKIMYVSNISTDPLPATEG